MKKNLLTQWVIEEKKQMIVKEILVGRSSIKNFLTQEEF